MLLAPGAVLCGQLALTVDADLCAVDALEVLAFELFPLTEEAIHFTPPLATVAPDPLVAWGKSCSPTLDCPHRFRFGSEAPSLCGTRLALCRAEVCVVVV